ncbi:MAG: hypothetical protein ACR2OX_00980 [Methyloligellaceae bacterium]
MTAKAPPISVYTDVARQVRTCWFAPGNPILKGHVFFAKTPQEKKVAEARITISTIARDGRRGLKAFTIDFVSRRKGTRVRTDNFRLPPALVVQLERDIRRWTDGETGCSNIAPLRGPALAQRRGRGR